MRTQTQVAGREVLVVWVKGAEPYLPVSGAAFTRAVRLSGIGSTQEKRSFLSKEGEGVTITDSNSARHSCNAIFLDELTDEMSSEIIHCKLQHMQYNYIIINMSVCVNMHS